MSKRLQEYDILRVIAVFSVIAIHITASYVLTSPLAYLCNQIVRFSVPLFIIMSGFLLYYADYKNGFIPVGIFYRKRFTKVLWPYLIWTFFYVAFSQLISGAAINWGSFLLVLAKHLLLGTGSYHLYFLLIIFQLYLIYPLLRKWLNSYPAPTLAISFLLTLICQTALYLDMLHIIVLPRELLPVYLVAFPVWLLFFVLGMYIAEKKENWEKALRTRVFSLFLIWLISLAILLLDSKITGSFGASIRPSVILYTISSYFFFYVIALRGRNIKSQILSWLAKQSFIIFLMHPFFLAVLVIAAPRLSHPGLWAGNRGMLLLYLATALLTLIGSYAISLTPFASILGGVAKKRHEK